MKTLLTITAAIALSGCSAGWLWNQPGDFAKRDTVNLECPGLPNKTVEYWADSAGNDYFLNDKGQYIELPQDCYATYPAWKQELSFITGTQKRKFKESKS